MKNFKIWFIIATIIIAIGGITFVIGMSCLNWDFTKLSTQKTVTNTYEITQNYHSIYINSDTADISFEVAQDEKTKVVCYEQEKLNHTVTVENGVLSISIVDERQWYEYVNIGFSSQSITVYLPIKDYATLSIKSSTSDVDIGKDFAFENADISISTGDVDYNAKTSEVLKISTSTGDIKASGIDAKTITLSAGTGSISLSASSCENLTVGVSTGNVNLVDISCEILTSSGSTGDLSLRNVIATQKFNLERETGDIKFDGCDAGEIQAKTITGNVSGTLLTEKIFIVETSTGEKDYPHSTSGGICHITTSTGDIKISIK